MNVFTKGVYTLCCIAAIVIGDIPLANASTLSQEHQKLNHLQQSKTSLGHQIHADTVRARTLQKTIQSHDRSLKTVEMKIVTKNHDILALQNREQQLNQQLSNDQTQLSKQQSHLASIVRADYEDGSISYLSVLFQASSFSDLLTRMHDLALITQEQNKMFSSVQTLTKSVSSDAKSVKTNEIQVAAEKSKLRSLEETQKTIIHQKKQNLHTVNIDLQVGKKKQGLLESQIKLTKNQIQKIEAETRAAEQRAKDPAYVREQQHHLVSANVSSMLSFANKFLGTPYVWGGTSTSGFDCSGFTQYVFHHAGVHINRTSEEQFASGVPVSKSNLKPGDLVFFSTYAPGATHVGIYIGNDIMIDCQDMGVSTDNVFNSYWGPKYIGARQYIK